jgi:hypothetical protein
MSETQEQQQTISETPAQRTKRLRKERIEAQLQENQRTASHKLNRLIFISLLAETGRDTCCRCGKQLTADTFSNDHMDHWLHSDNPRGKYFDIKNIDFSCKRCNSSYTRARAGADAYDERLQRVTGWRARKPLLTPEEIHNNPQPETPVESKLEFTIWKRMANFLVGALRGINRHEMAS